MKRRKITAKALVNVLKHETEFKSRNGEDGAWDWFSCKNPCVITVNRGFGFEDAVAVVAPDFGTSIYCGPFFLVHNPTRVALLLFEADQMLFLKDVKLK